VSASLPTLKFDDEALRTRTLTPEQLTSVADAFKSAGCMLVEKVLDVAIVDAMHDAFVDRYHRYLEGQSHDDALEVGARRFMVTVALEPPFADPEVYANPLLLPILAALLDDVRLFSFRGVVALPGSAAQHVHRDGPGLFNDEALDGAVPPFAVSVLIPLVDINEETGTTRVWPGTHREFRAGVGPFFEMDPVIPRGSVLLIDYRLFHGGTQNRSPAPRPILYNVYARPWYRDSRNYRKQPPLVISPDELARVRDEHKVLFTEMLVANHSLPPGRATPTS
jgi:ectoine hydroxylase-related dioxygenase (phytanoyl-CoA dioxygenase family)